MDHEMVSVSDAKVRFHELVARAADRVIILLRRSRPDAVLVSYQRWVDMLREIEDLKDRLSAYRSKESPADLRVPLEKLKVELGLPIGRDED